MTRTERQILTETRDIVIRVEQRLEDHIKMGDERKRNGISRWEAWGQWIAVAVALILHVVRGHK